MENTQDLAGQLAANIAIRCQIEDVLERLFRHEKESVRFFGIQEIYELWTANATLAENLLNSLGNEIKLTQIRRSRTYLDSLLKCSVLLLCREYLVIGENTSSLPVVLGIWRKLIRRYFLVSPIKSVDRVLRHLRFYILSLAVVGVTKLLSRVGTITGFISNYEDLKSFFPADSYRKKTLQDLFDYFDKSAGQPVETIESFTEYVETLIRNGDDDLMTSAFVLAIATAYISSAPLVAAKALHDLYLRVVEIFPPTEDADAPTAPIWVRMLILPFLNAPYFQVEKSIAIQIVKLFIDVEYLCDQRFRGASQFASGNVSKWDFMGGGICIAYALDPENVGRPALKHYLELLVQRKDHYKINQAAFVLSDISLYVQMSGAGINATNDALAMLQDYLSDLSEPQQNLFWEKLVDGLVLIYGVRDPSALKAFSEIAYDDLPDAARVRLSNSSAPQSFDLVLVVSMAAFARESLRDKNPAVRNLLKDFFEIALEARNIQVWLTKCVVYLGNLVYGDELFPT